MLISRNGDYSCEIRKREYVPNFGQRGKDWHATVSRKVAAAIPPCVAYPAYKLLGFTPTLSLYRCAVPNKQQFCLFMMQEPSTKLHTWTNNTIVNRCVCFSVNVWLSNYQSKSYKSKRYSRVDTLKTLTLTQQYKHYFAENASEHRACP